MKKSLFGLAVGTALAISALPAFADGYGYGSIKDAVPAAPQPNWSGLYIGAAVGYSIATTELDAFADGWCDCPHVPYGYITANIDGVSGKGVQGVLTIGYDRQIHPNVLVGIFADYAFGDIETDASLRWGDEHIAGGVRLDADISNSWAIGARLGYIHSPATMLYVAAGYARADLDWKITAFEQGEPSEVHDSGGKSLSGWFIGGGIEHQLRDNLFLKLDYRYTNYDTERLFAYFVGDEDCGESGYLDSDTDVHSIRLGLNWKVDLFGTHHAAYDTLK